VLNLQSQQANGMIYLSYAVIFFGLLQGGQGLIEFLKAQKAPTQQKK
jgi:hypothetical protein